MSWYGFAREQTEAAKARVIADTSVLRRLGVQVNGVSTRLDDDRVEVMVEDAAVAEPIIRERYGDIVYLVEGRGEPLAAPLSQRS